MYGETLPRTGIAIGASGTVLNLSWLIVAALAIIVGGVLLTRYGKRHENA
jgi:hypothetical protein